MALSECPECSRHVRVGTKVCPFCDHALPSGFGRARAGAMLVGAAALTTMTACPRIAATKYGGPPPPPPEPSAIEEAEPPEDLEAAEGEADDEADEAGAAEAAEPDGQ